MRLLIIFLCLISLSLISCRKDPEILKQDREQSGPTPYTIDIPEGFPEMPVPPDNPTTVEGVALGRKLFYDPILSGDHTMACSDCHQQSAAFTDPGKKLSTGIHGDEGTRNSSAIINSGWSPPFFWDGRAESLEEQALEPVINPVEMHLPWDSAVNRLKNHPEYPQLFAEAFETEEISRDLVVKAIAQFERTIISSNSKYDRVNRGIEAFTPEEQAGMDLFFSEQGECFHCHGTALFTDNQFHNNGLDDEHSKDAGLGKVTGKFNDYGKFKTPTLRNVEVTGPYMHDGRFETLEEVIDFYSDNVKFSVTLDPLMGHGHFHGNLTGFHFTPTEKRQLIAFLKTLTDDTFLSNPEYGKP